MLSSVLWMRKQAQRGNCSAGSDALVLGDDACSNSLAFLVNSDYRLRTGARELQMGGKGGNFLTPVIVIYIVLEIKASRVLIPFFSRPGVDYSDLMLATKGQLQLWASHSLYSCDLLVLITFLMYETGYLFINSNKCVLRAFSVYTRDSSGLQVIAVN